jgi:hypothetical protein
MLMNLDRKKDVLKANLQNRHVARTLGHFAIRELVSSMENSGNKPDKQPCSAFSYSITVEYNNKDARSLAFVMNSVIHTLFTFRFVLAKKSTKLEPGFNDRVFYVCASRDYAVYLHLDKSGGSNHGGVQIAGDNSK